MIDAVGGVRMRVQAGSNSVQDRAKFGVDPGIYV